MRITPTTIAIFGRLLFMRFPLLQLRMFFRTLTAAAAGGFDLLLRQTRLFHLQDLIDRTARFLDGRLGIGREGGGHCVRSEKGRKYIVGRGRDVATLGALASAELVVPGNGGRAELLALRVEDRETEVVMQVCMNESIRPPIADLNQDQTLRSGRLKNLERSVSMAEGSRFDGLCRSAAALQPPAHQIREVLSQRLL